MLDFGTDVCISILQNRKNGVQSPGNVCGTLMLVCGKVGHFNAAFFFIPSSRVYIIRSLCSAPGLLRLL